MFNTRDQLDLDEQNEKDRHEAMMREHMDASNVDANVFKVVDAATGQQTEYDDQGNVIELPKAKPNATEPA